MKKFRLSERTREFRSDCRADSSDRECSRSTNLARGSDGRRSRQARRNDQNPLRRRLGRPCGPTRRPFPTRPAPKPRGPRSIGGRLLSAKARTCPYRLRNPWSPHRVKVGERRTIKSLVHVAETQHGRSPRSRPRTTATARLLSRAAQPLSHPCLVHGGRAPRRSGTEPPNIRDAAQPARRRFRFWTPRLTARGWRDAGARLLRRLAACGRRSLPMSLGRRGMAPGRMRAIIFSLRRPDAR